MFDWCLPVNVLIILIYKQNNPNPKHTNGKISIQINTKPPSNQNNPTILLHGDKLG